MILFVISGGQTGADMGGLIGAKAAGYPTGGYAPKGYMTENGPELSLISYNLVEAGPGWIDRTNKNASWADLTLWFGNDKSAGGIATKRACDRSGKPFAVVTSWDPIKIAQFLKSRNVKVLNIAGNRESHSKGLQDRVSIFVQNMLMEYSRL